MVRLIATVLFWSVVGVLSAQSEPRVLLSIHKTEGFSNFFWDTLREGARTEAAKQGLLLTIQGVAPEWATDPAAGQTRVIEAAIGAGYAGVLVTPADRLRLVAPVQEAVLSGIPVVAIDAPLDTNLLSALIATDNYRGGLDAARALAQALGYRGRVAILAHPSAQNQAIRDRREAFLAGLAQFAPEIRVVSSDRAGQATVETDQRVVATLLADFPDLDGLYTLSGSGTLGAYQALRAARVGQRLRLVGWDGDATTVAALKRGEIEALVQQDARRLGSAGVQALAEALAGRPPRKATLVPATVVTRANAHTPGVQALLPPGPVP